MPEEQRSQHRRARALFGGAEAIKHFRTWATPEDFFENAKKKLWWRPDDL